MSLLNEVQKFIEAHPGCTSGDIADAFAGYSRQRVLQSASKLRQSGRVAHRCEGDTRRHFSRLTERAQEPEPQPVRETRPVRKFYVGTNDPRVILCLTRQAEELESRGLYRRAATVWMAAFRESHSQPERNNFLARRERCLRKSSKRAISGARRTTFSGELTPCLARLFWICSLTVITPNVLRITRRKTTRWRMTGQNALRSLKVLPLVIPHTAAPVSMRGNTSPACVTS